MNKMKIVFFGTPQFAVPSLEALTKIPNMEILAVVTQPDKPVGRKQILSPSPVKMTAKELGLKILQPKNKEELKKLMKDYEADFFVVIAYGMLFPKEILSIPTYGCINIHASLLPKYRGASPIQEAILNGDKETGITFMDMDEKMDEGAAYLIKRIEILQSDNLESLTAKLSKLSGQLIPMVLIDIVSGLLIPLKQITKNATYCKKIKKEDGKIDWNKSADEINNMIKAYTPWPSAYTTLNGKKLQILDATIENSNDQSRKPGTFIIDGKILKITTKTGYLLPKKIQLEGKKEMDIISFVNGYKNLLNA